MRLSIPLADEETKKEMKRLQLCEAALECPQAGFAQVQHSGRASPSWLSALRLCLKFGPEASNLGADPDSRLPSPDSAPEAEAGQFSCFPG